MVYISQGKVVAKRGVCRFSIILDIFWGIVGFFYVFFSSLFGCKKAAGKESRIRGVRGAFYDGKSWSGGGSGGGRGAAAGSGKGGSDDGSGGGDCGPGG